jgi:hypothetical protein
MLVWGGRDGRRSFGDGAADDPRADRWRPIAGRGASPVAAAWTGTRMLVWDAPSAGGRTTGALYDPVPDRRTGVNWHPASDLEWHGDRSHRLRPGVQQLVDPAGWSAGPG